MRVVLQGSRVTAMLGAAALCMGVALGDAASPAPTWPSPRPHLAGDVFNYAVSGTMSTAIEGKDGFARPVHQAAVPTLVQGRERVAIKAVTPQGLALHRSGTIVATFRGKSSPPQPGAGWTLITPQGIVEDRKGSTLGGLFLLPLGFLADRSVNAGTALQVGDKWVGKLGVALFGMTARPMMAFEVAGTREIFGATVFTLAATGTAPVTEPIVTDDDVAMGDARGTAHLTLHCDYDPHLLRVVSMEIDLIADLHIVAHGHSPAGSVRDRQHYLVALDAASLSAMEQVAPASTPAAVASPTSY